MTCWIQSLHEYTLTSPPQGEEEDAIRIFLCTRRDRVDSLPADIALPIRSWLNKSTNLVYHHAVASALRYTEDFHRLGGSLLTWGLTRPWADQMQVQPLLEQWYRALHEPNLFSDTLASNMAYATSIVRNVLPQLHAQERNALANLWLDRVMKTSPQSLLWQIGMYAPDVRERVMDAWADLYTIALAQRGNPGVLDWLKCVEASFQELIYNPASILLMLLARNQLPGPTKVFAAASCSPSVWLDPAVSSVLVPIAVNALPAPAMRMLYLPWTSNSNVFVKDSHERADAHRRMCEVYCPELMPIFGLVSVDWLDKAMVCRIAYQYTSQKKDNLSVVGLLE